MSKLVCRINKHLDLYQNGVNFIIRFEYEDDNGMESFAQVALMPYDIAFEDKLKEMLSENSAQ